MVQAGIQVGKRYTDRDDRVIPITGLSYRRNFWRDYLDLTEKVAVYWTVEANSITIVAYYDTVGEANTAALEAVDGQQYPTVEINWWHTDFTKYKVGARTYRDSQEDLPDWVDANPGYQFA